MIFIVFFFLCLYFSFVITFSFFFAYTVYYYFYFLIFLLFVFFIYSICCIYCIYKKAKESYNKRKIQTKEKNDYKNHKISYHILCLILLLVLVNIRFTIQIQSIQSLEEFKRTQYQQQILAQPLHQR